MYAASKGIKEARSLQQIHIGLIENKIGPNRTAVGLGFPEYGSEKFPLGTRLRIFSNEFQTLEKFNISNWLQRLMDFVTISEIKDVPQDVTFHYYTRQ